MVTSRAIQTEKVESTFPKLMKRKLNGLVVLFTDKSTGTVVAAGNTDNYVGEYSQMWCKAFFEDFTGTVTIKNS